MARLEDRIEKAALAIQQKAITRAGESRTSSKSLESKKNSLSLDKVGFRPAEANFNNLCDTFCKEELYSSLARAAEITLALPNEINQTLLDQTKWFGRWQ